MSTPTTGHGVRRDAEGRTYIQFTRTFLAPIDDVWAAVTEADRLARWIGNWTGDPAQGEVRFQMLFEGDDMPAERFRIDACEAPRQLRITTSSPYDGENPQTWRLRLDLSEQDGVTTLTFAQDVPEPGMAEGVGPGWHYYMDRLVAAETGTDVAGINFDDYHPALGEHYLAEFN